MGEDKKKLYDTNVLIDLVKSGENPGDGYTTALNLVEYPKGVSLDLGVLIPSPKEYALAVKLSEKLVKAGTPVPAVDVIIAAVAISRGMALITKDRHFLLVKDVAPELRLELVE
ncbi:PIN domain-containing protein [Thermococcus sp. GR7]|uniref:type II toxin-antitoxin system VapC family toxin n=1 Tax=unclassified Thermococcus TaxID=2627626 RepID=UPI00142F59AA|nr:MULTISPECIES: type II toxin-antitoxin system VapC family toxin [unclassified Thermococcus]NJE45919.1 PIN domain-containing protein [Thermococcus sp. GR7]NJE78810.1 PIN domain-containing protein [Thermococcus sp. GR4]NJF22114.1 PIN domain-containing protein [Thermococcus sp. GR5]